VVKINEDAEFIWNLWLSDKVYLNLKKDMLKDEIFVFSHNEILLHCTLIIVQWTVFNHYKFELVRIWYCYHSDFPTTYVTILETFSGEKLQFFQSIDVENTWFQQDGATSHADWVSMAAVRRMFAVTTL